MIWVQSRIWVEKMPLCESLSSTWGTVYYRGGRGCLGWWLWHLRSDGGSCLLFFCLQFLFSHPREEGAMLSGGGREEGLKDLWQVST